MLIGIVSDIHDADAPLRVALARFRELGVEQVVTLGDAFEASMGQSPSAEVARLLRDAGAVGVWGNHDFGLSRDVGQVHVDPLVIEFASRLKPQLVIEDCRFSHIEHHLDPTQIMDLWFFDGVPYTLEKARRSFEAVSEKFLFMGHHHVWVVVGSDGAVSWDIEEPVTLTAAERYLVVMGAVLDGWCATFDTITAELTPLRCLDLTDGPALSDERRFVARRPV